MDDFCDLFAAQIDLELQRRITEITELIEGRWYQLSLEIARGEIIRIPISDDHISDSNSSTSTCPICLDDFVLGEAGGQLHCGHLYHQDCISTWLRSDNSCPTCRRVFPRSRVIISSRELFYLLH